MSTLFDMALKLLLLFQPRIWSSIPRSYRECSSISESIAKIKFWYPENWPCRHLSNRLYIEQVICHLLMLLLSARACSETAKAKLSLFLNIFDRGLSLIETSRLIFALQIGWLLSLWCVKCGDFVWFLGWKFFVGRTVFTDLWSS